MMYFHTIQHWNIAVKLFILYSLKQLYPTSQIAGSFRMKEAAFINLFNMLKNNVSGYKQTNKSQISKQIFTELLGPQGRVLTFKP